MSSYYVTSTLIAGLELTHSEQYFMMLVAHLKITWYFCSVAFEDIVTIIITILSMMFMLFVVSYQFCTDTFQFHAQ